MWTYLMRIFEEQIWIRMEESVELRLLRSFKDPTYPNKYSLRSIHLSRSPFFIHAFTYVLCGLEFIYVYFCSYLFYNVYMNFVWSGEASIILSITIL